MSTGTTTMPANRFFTGLDGLVAIGVAFSKSTTFEHYI